MKKSLAILFGIVVIGIFMPILSFADIAPKDTIEFTFINKTNNEIFPVTNCQYRTCTDTFCTEKSDWDNFFGECYRNAG